ncbi:MAG TPA: hypothetical protein VGE93_14610, partial [Bryobacteraceae bacterium]
PYHMARLGGDPNVVLHFLESHFSHGRIEETDARAGKEGAIESMTTITARLRSTITQWRDNPQNYVDIFATKAPLAE